MFGCRAKIFQCCLLAVLAIEGFSLKLSMADKNKRIHGGKSVNIKDRPYLVQLRDIYFNGSDCSGTLVDATHVITAAHCLQILDPVTDMVVVGGASTKSEDGVKRKIVAAYIEPNYNKDVEYNHDIAVLKLESAMVGKNIKPISTSYEPVEDGKLLTVSGWGRTQNGELGPNDLARTVRVEKISNDVCNQKNGDISTAMICAASPGKDACNGDSGGPAIYRDKLVGVVSWGLDCAHPDYPGVYTSIANAKDFLLKHLKK